MSRYGPCCLMRDFLSALFETVRSHSILLWQKITEPVNNSQAHLRIVGNQMHKGEFEWFKKSNQFPAGCSTC